MLGSYTFNGFTPRAMPIVAAGAKRSIVRDDTSAHPIGSTVGSEGGADSRIGSTNYMENSAGYNPETAVAAKL